MTQQTTPVSLLHDSRSTRRHLSAAAGAFVCTASFGSARSAGAQTKLAQALVGYQNSPQGAEDCGNCLQFEPPASCKIVAGNISPGAWCKVYAKKPA